MIEGESEGDSVTDASYRGDAQVTTWLHRVVVNACLDRLRSMRSRETEPLPENLGGGGGGGWHGSKSRCARGRARLLPLLIHLKAEEGS